MSLRKRRYYILHVIIFMMVLIQGWMRWTASAWMWLGVRQHPICSASCSSNTLVTLPPSHSAAWRSCCMSIVILLWIIMKVRWISARLYNIQNFGLWQNFCNFSFTLPNGLIMKQSRCDWSIDSHKKFDKTISLTSRNDFMILCIVHPF